MVNGWVEIKYKDLPIDSQKETFYISIKFLVASHVNMLQQLHLPANLIICKHEKISSKFFSTYLIKLTLKLKRKLD